MVPSRGTQDRVGPMPATLSIQPPVNSRLRLQEFCFSVHEGQKAYYVSYGQNSAKAKGRGSYSTILIEHPIPALDLELPSTMLTVSQVRPFLGYGIVPFSARKARAPYILSRAIRPCLEVRGTYSWLHNSSYNPLIRPLSRASQVIIC